MKRHCEIASRSFNGFSRVHVCDRRTDSDRRTDKLGGGEKRRDFWSTIAISEISFLVGLSLA